MKKHERQVDLLKIIKSLDISPTLYKNAVEKYQNIATFLAEHGVSADFYPQGSFALGTVTRPYMKDNDKNYDLDFICQISGNRESNAPGELWNKLISILKNSEMYKDKITVYDKCITINYAEINNIGFNIDIVPATDESTSIKSKLLNESPYPELIDSAIAIAVQSDLKEYNWGTNNPKGYRLWFEKINAPFREYSRQAYRQMLFTENSSFYNTIEEIPDEMERSSMQQVIQILKAHRDIYYSHISNADDLKPISAIINTLVAEIAQNLPSTLSTFELLEQVLNELAIYSQQQNMVYEDFIQSYSSKTIIKRQDNVWKIENPANPEDNLADKWNQFPKAPIKFFGWINAAKTQLIDSLNLSDADFRAISENAFGQQTINKLWGQKYQSDIPKPITATTKPWGEL